MNDALLIHIYGPWGYGKTTLFNLLRTDWVRNF